MIISLDVCELIFWAVAISMSIFWGIYGILDEAYNVHTIKKTTKTITGSDEETCSVKKVQTEYDFESTNPVVAFKELGWVYGLGAFLSDFAWSILGWIALYKLHSQYCNPELVTFNIFLGIVAIVGITGYGFKIPEKIKIGSN